MADKHSYQAVVISAAMTDTPKRRRGTDPKNLESALRGKETRKVPKQGPTAKHPIVYDITRLVKGKAFILPGFPPPKPRTLESSERPSPPESSERAPASGKQASVIGDARDDADGESNDAMNGPYGDDTLLTVRLGSRIDQLFYRFPELHAHRFSDGIILFEACNQITLNVFTFIEEPQSRGYVTKLWFRQAEDISVCRDENGALPHVAYPAVTPRGVWIGDPANKVIDRYGQPDSVRKQVDGTNLYIYDMPTLANAEAEDIILSFKVDMSGKVVGFMLEGDRPQLSISGPSIYLDITALKGRIFLG